MMREMFVIAAVAFLFGAAGHRQLRLNRPAPVTATTVNIAGVLGRWPCAQGSVEPEKSIGASVKRESPNKQHCNNQQQSADDDEVQHPSGGTLNRSSLCGMEIFRPDDAFGSKFVNPGK